MTSWLDQFILGYVSNSISKSFASTCEPAGE